MPRVSSATRHLLDSQKSIKKLLKDLATHKITPALAFKALKGLPYKDLKFAKIDHHRLLRKGLGEVVYCEGKTPAQIKKILREIIKRNGQVFLTRASKDLADYLKKEFAFLKYNELARIIYAKKQEPKSKKTVLILTAGTSDMPVAEEARLTLEIMGNRVKAVYDVGVAGIHRLFDRLNDISSANVIIVVAGMEGALASFVAGLTENPVIAVPTSVGYGSSFKGIAPLLTMMNCCSPGVTVVNIDNGFGAGYFASLINK
ncbi:MAG: nickel pincer cofactor biosynthesis protein LarB [Candidatus Omnitrophica bacterium]|nr:nickel pincer cofactor biosynthesis protein LarB [Candidatus Omnitrophota bacterium]MBU4149733.1 nickel pincer cofactor biosynthesis protein LarB [Candidatus Omnitrophota bacterium]